MIALGFLALVLGIVFDWQRIFPAFGDRVAALCALVVGQTLIARTQLGKWLNDLTGGFAHIVGRTASEVDTQFAVISTLIVGLLVGMLAFMWMCAFLPNVTFLRKHVGDVVSNEMNSWLIWSGMLLPPLMATVPGFWGAITRGTTEQGSNIGEVIVKAVLG